MLGVLSCSKIQFPKDFLWGSAVSAYQVEGNDVNSHNWHDGLAGHCQEPCGAACNNYELYQQDVQMLHDLGHTAFRLSIPWSRIEPEQGHFNPQAVEHYRDYLRRLKSNGIKTFVTLSHGSDPEWFFQLGGGFAKRENISFFERYVEYIVPKLDEFVDFWMTINEINIMGGVGGIANSDLRANYMVAHAKAYRIVHSLTNKPVGAPHAMIVDMPVRPNCPLDRTAAALEDWIDNGFFIHAIKTGELVFPCREMEYIPELRDSSDFWAINYYSRAMVSSRSPKRDAVKYTFAQKNLVDTKWSTEFWPEGLATELERFSGMPIYISENGICADDDRWRILKLAQDLMGIRDAITFGSDVRGYLHWSLMDNYEWFSYGPKFGMVAVDRKTFRRTPKPSALFYRELIAANGFDGKLVQKYLPDIPVLRTY